jgi:hypothetical protein
VNATHLPLRARRLDSVDEQERSRMSEFVESLRNFATLSECLRVLGAGVVLASMSLYLMQGWQTGNDINRYLMLLAQTALLAIAGFAMSHGLKEARGARVFFGLALVSIPANFTILGALLYSVFQWDGALTTYPGFATWRIDQLAATGLTMGCALLVLLPVSGFCFAVMARKSAGRLTLHFALLNLLLLLPVRASVVAGALALLGIAHALWITRRLLAENPAFRTAEGRFALGVLYVPMAIMLFRSLYFYDIDSLMVAMLAMAAFIAMRQTALFPHRSARLANALHVASLPMAALVVLALAEALSPPLTAAWLAPLTALSYAAFGFDIWRRTPNRKVRSVAAGAVSVALTAGFSLGVALQPSAIMAALALLTGTLMIAGGYRTRGVLPVTGGCITLTAGGLLGFDALFAVVVASSWVTLAVVGTSAIVVGSLLDRHGALLRERARQWFRPLVARSEYAEESDW